MTKPRIVQVGALPGDDQAALEDAYDVAALWKAQDPARLLEECGPAARAIVTRGDLTADGALIAALPALEIIAVYGVGYDGVDLDAARARGVRVTNTPGVLTDDVADYAVAMLLAQTRALVAADHWARSGAWGREGAMPLQRRASGKRAGVVGLGRIGGAVAQRLEAFGMTIGYSGRAPKPDQGARVFFEHVAALAAWADFLVVACASTPQTRHLVDRTVIEALGPTGVLVNIARAAIVDEAALLDALEDGRLGGAALDVFENEPVIDPRFAALDNVLLQPHQGSATRETRKAMADLMRANLDAHFKGETLPTPVL